MHSPDACAPELLIARFDEFIDSARRLESSHRELQDEVVRLRRELEERNQALEKSLHEVDSIRQVLLRVLDAMPCGVVLLDSTGRSPLIANPEAQRLLWCNGTTGAQLPLPLQQIIARMRSYPNDFSSEEEIFTDSTEPARWLSVKATRVTFSGTACEHNHLLIIQDVSAQKQCEQDRESVRNSLALAEMSSVLAHEVRNPLGAMELFLSLLRSQGGLGTEALTWTEHLAAGVRTLAATVNNVLQFYTTGLLTMSRIDVEALINKSAQFLEPVANESAIKLEIRSSLHNARINGDEQALRQVILNLCVNSIRHSSEGGAIEIAVKKHGGSKVRIQVSDSGTGIADEHLPHIFEAGFSASGRSSGLGLAVCKRIVEAHDGTIGVLHSNCQGTTMYVELPAL
jgi:two-component system sensor histidine kinase FlrB